MAHKNGTKVLNNMVSGVSSWVQGSEVQGLEVSVF